MQTNIISINHKYQHASVKAQSHYSAFPLRCDSVVLISKTPWDRKKNMIFFIKMEMSRHPHCDQGVATELTWRFIAFLRSFCWRLLALLRRFHCLHCAFTALWRCFHRLHCAFTALLRRFNCAHYAFTSAVDYNRPTEHVCVGFAEFRLVTGADDWTATNDEGGPWTFSGYRIYQTP